MKTVEIKAVSRNEFGKKSSKAIRSTESVPGILYGGEKNVAFSVVAADLKEIIYSPYVYLTQLNVEGTVYNCIKKETQFHPVSGELLHIDFQQVIPGKPAYVSLPLAITGASVGVKKGGKLRQVKRTVKVKGLTENLPDEVKVDISDLDINQSLSVGDLSLENITFIDSPKTLLISILPSRATAKAAEAPAKK
jgi:large subunit ribosomal protein L25